MTAVKNKDAADVVRQRAGVLGLDNIRLLVEASKGRATPNGVSEKTWTPLIKRDTFPVRDDIRRAMSRALGWTADSFDRILRGEPPVIEGADGATDRATPPEEPPQWARDLLAKIDAVLERVPPPDSKAG